MINDIHEDFHQLSIVFDNNTDRCGLIPYEFDVTDRRPVPVSSVILTFMTNYVAQPTSTLRLYAVQVTSTGFRSAARFLRGRARATPRRAPDIHYCTCACTYPRGPGGPAPAPRSRPRATVGPAGSRRRRDAKFQ